MENPKKLTLEQKIELLVDGIISQEKHLSYSSLKQFAKSPSHFIEYKFGEREPTKPKEFGSLFDIFLLEPEKFDGLYATYKEEDRPLKDNTMRKVENKTWLEGLRLAAEKEKKILVNITDVEQAQFMAARIKACKPAWELLSRCTTTQEDLDFTYKGFRFKGKKDRSCSEYTVDLKTAADASSRGFKYAIKKLNYGIQAIIYNIGDGDPCKPYFLAAIEKKPPFAVGAYEILEQRLKAEKKKLDFLLENFTKCLYDPSLFRQGYEFWEDRTNGIHQVGLF